MTTDQKIDQVLTLLEEQDKRSDARFIRLETRNDELLGLIQEQERRSEVRFNRLEARDDELLRLIQELGQRSEARDHELLRLIMDQVDRVDDLKGEMQGMKTEMIAMKVDLSAKIDRSHDSLSQDIQAFSGDLHQLERRTTRLEKKLFS